MSLKLLFWFFGFLCAKQVVRSGDLLSYTAEEGIRILCEGKFLVSDPFPGNDRNKYCLSSKVKQSEPTYDFKTVSSALTTPPVHSPPKSARKYKQQ